MSIWVNSRPAAWNMHKALYLLAGGLIFLLLFVTRSAEQTRDSLVYALSAKTGLEIFHPHHLIYNPIIRQFYLAIRLICPDCDAVLAGQIHNILWAVIGVLALYAALAHLWKPGIAMAVTALFLGLRGYWELATQTTMYVPGAAILAVISALLLTGDIERTQALQPTRTALLAILLALAVLYHQSNILFVVPLGVYLIAQQGKIGFRRWLLITALAGLICLLSYVLVFVVSNSALSVTGFIQFCLSYTNEICLGGLCKTSPDGWGSLANISMSGANQLLSSLLWNILVLPGQIEAWILPLIGFGILALIIWHTVKATRQPAYRALRLFSLTWFILYTAFFFWWLPDYPHPFVTTVIPLILLTLLGMQEIAALRLDRVHFEHLTIVSIAIAAVLIAGRNFQARILPLNQSAGDAYQEAAALDAAAEPGCIFLTSYRTWNHLRYYFDRQTAVQARHPMSFFYQSEPLPAQYHIANQPCVFVAATFLLPTYVNEDYSDDPIDAYQTPDLWMAYLSWLFAIEFNPQDQTVTSRDYEVVEMADGPPYLRLLPSRQTARGLSELFTELDASIDAHTRPFQSWYVEISAK